MLNFGFVAPKDTPLHGIASFGIFCIWGLLGYGRHEEPQNHSRVKKPMREAARACLLRSG